MAFEGCGRGVSTSCIFTLTTDMSFSDFYGSDLSDITSSSDEEFTVKKSSAKKPKRNQPSYTIVNPLRPPRSTSYSVRALYGEFFHYLFLFFLLTPIRTNRRWINQLRSSLSKRCVSFILSTEVALHLYLVDIVWPEQKQIGLIDSVFRNYYIPPIIFGELTVFPYPITSPSDPLESCFNIG